MVYSSKYYDPVKAHEYYMRNRKLKGRTRTGTLNDVGTKAKNYVLSEISKEKESILNKQSEKYHKEIESENKSYSDLLASSTKQISNKILLIQKKFNKLSNAQKKILGPKIKMELEKLKNENALKREKLKSLHFNNIKEINNQNNNNKMNINDEYSKISENEIDKIYSDSSMIKSEKTKKLNKKETNTEKTKSKLPPKLLELRKQYEREAKEKEKKKK